MRLSRVLWEAAYKVPTPQSMGFKVSRPIKQGEAKKGMRLGHLDVVSASPKRVVVVDNHIDHRKHLVYQWDGKRYVRGVFHLWTTGGVVVEGEQPDKDKDYPVGTTFRSRDWTLVVVAPGEPMMSPTIPGRRMYTSYKVKKLGGNKILGVTLYAQGGVAVSWQKKPMTGVFVSPP
jgi:hypothetical protein